MKKIITYLSICCMFSLMNIEIYAQDLLNPTRNLSFTYQYEDTVKVLKYIDLAKNALDNNNQNKLAKQYADSAYKLALTIPWKKGEILHWNIYGIASRYNSHYTNSVEYHSIALDLSREIKDESLEAISLNNIAVAWRRTDNYTEAIKCHLQAANLADKAGLISTKSYALNGLGNSYLQIYNYEKALEYFDQAYDLAIKTNNLLSQAINLNNMGDALLALNEYDKAFESYTKSLELNLQIKSKIGIVISYISIAKSLAAQNKYEQAIEYYIQVLDSEDIVEDKFHSATAQIEASYSYLQVGQYAKAERLLTEGLESAKLIKSKFLESKAYEYSSMLYSKEKKFEQAFNYSSLYAKTKDELINEEIQKNIAGLQISNEFNRNKDRIRILEKDKENQEIKSRQVIYSIAIAAFLIIAFVTYFLLYRQFRIKKESNAKLKQLLSEKLVLIAEIHHRVKNNLALIAGLIQLQSGNKENQTEIDALDEIHNRVLTFSHIYENIYDTDNFQAIDFSKFIESYLESFNHKYIPDNVFIKTFVSEIFVSLQTAIPLALICNELITNSLKYAFDKGQGGELTIRLSEKENNMCQLYISDTGIGMAHSPEESGKTGFLIISINAAQLGAKYTVETAPEKGLVFKMDFLYLKKND